MSLTFENISFTVDGERHIYETNMTFKKSTMNVLLGATLSGKTTLMRLMAGLEKPTTGRLLWNGEDVTGKRVQERDIAFIYQQFINYPTLSVYENIASPLRVMKKSNAEIDEKVKNWAALMKLTPFLDRRPLELSGGQQQRCALARALIKEAGLVLMDEPLANLDYKLREELREEIPKIFEQSGAIFIYATTEPEEALLLGGNTATIHEGRVTQFGNTSSLYHNPKNTTTAGIFSNPPMNFLNFNKSNDKVIFADGTITTAIENIPNGDFIAGFRSNHLELSDKNKKAIKFDTTLVTTEITGSETYLHMHHHDKKWVALVHGVHELPLGENISVYLDPAHIFIFDQVGQLVLLPAYKSNGV